MGKLNCEQNVSLLANMSTFYRGIVPVMHLKRGKRKGKGKDFTVESWTGL